MLDMIDNVDLCVLDDKCSVYQWDFKKFYQKMYSFWWEIKKIFFKKWHFYFSNNYNNFNIVDNTNSYGLDDKSNVSE